MPRLGLAPWAVLVCLALAGKAFAACDSSCLTCDEKTGDCLECPARMGLDLASNPRRCKTCDSTNCIECGDNFKNCTLCAFGLNNYIAVNGTCQWCDDYMGSCDPKYGCRADGSCIACDDDEGYVMIKGACVRAEDGCNTTSMALDGSGCKACNAGYVRLANGSCQACPDGCAVCTEAGACISCFAEPWRAYTMVGGKCVQCPDGCLDCEGNPKQCRKCNPGQGGMDAKTGKCVACADKNCYDCADDKGTCKSCNENYYAKGGKCVQCNEGCDSFPCDSATHPDGCTWTSETRTCSDSGVCVACDTKYGRVGEACEKCKVNDCWKCDGDAKKCTECGYYYASEKSSVGFKMYPSKDNSSCIVCQAHKQCTDCDGAEGKCTSCAPGWGAVNGTCVKCEVEGCGNCDGDATACKQCEQIGDNCEASFWFDARTRSCIKINAILDC